MTDGTARMGLPLMAAGQAQKEVTHNEALALLDLVTQAGVAAIGLNAAPDAPEEGQAWIVGTTPAGAWAGRANALAGWTAGGWRFATPGEGWSAWSAADGCAAIFTNGAWRLGVVSARELRIGDVRVVGPRRPAIAAATGGATVDAEARATLAAVLDALVAHGLIGA